MQRDGVDHRPAPSRAARRQARLREGAGTMSISSTSNMPGGARSSRRAKRGSPRRPARRRGAREAAAASMPSLKGDGHGARLAAG